MNESTVIALGLFDGVHRGHGALLPARGLGLLTGLAAIPALFYTYQGILGRGIMWVDVLIFQLAVLLAFWVSWSVQARRVLDGPVWQILGGVTLLAVWGLAIWWTYAPPQLPLFPINTSTSVSPLTLPFSPPP